MKNAKEQALDAFIGTISEINGTLEILQNYMDDHMNVSPDAVKSPVIACNEFWGFTNGVRCDKLSSKHEAGFIDSQVLKGNSLSGVPSVFEEVERYALF